MTLSKKQSIKFIFCTLAPIEMSFSLRMLANPSEYPEVSSWAKKKFDDLSSNLKSDILFFNDHYQWYFITDLLVYLIAEDEVCVDDISVLLKRIVHCSNIDFLYGFLGLSVEKFDKKKISLWLQSRENIEKEDFALATKFISEEDVFYCLENVEKIKERLIRLLRQYWVESFHSTWRKIKEYENEAINFQRIKYQHEEPLHYLSSLHPDLKIVNNQLYFDREEDKFSIPIDKIRTVVIKPSVFIGDRLSGNIIDNKVTVTLRLNFHSVMTSAAAPHSLSTLIWLLNDPSRLRIIKVLWNNDATTKELAEILNLSPTTVSLHLKQMKEGDFVTTKKIKKYVYYQLRKDKFYGLESKLLRYLTY